MELLARARIVMWEGASLWVLDATLAEEPSRTTDSHAHHAIQAAFGLGGWFRLDAAGAEVRGEAVAVASDIQHVFAAEGLFALLFIEPESKAGRAAHTRLFGKSDVAAIPDEILGAFRERIVAAFRAARRDDAALIALGKEMVSALAGDVEGAEPDARIRKVIEWAAEEIESQIGLSGAVAVAGLSASRLRHLFVEQTGLPFKTYLLWLRLTRAVERIAAGVNLTKAAHEAGFADSAHLSRTFRRMFGVAPTALRMV
jgi:AraC-like DNA-binding protein